MAPRVASTTGPTPWIPTAVSRRCRPSPLLAALAWRRGHAGHARHAGELVDRDPGVVPAASRGARRVGPGAFAPGPLSEPDLWVTHPALWVPVSADGQCCPARGRCNRLASASLAPRSFAVLRFAMCSRKSLPPDASDGPDSPPPGGLAANTNFSWRDLMLQNPSPPSLRPLSRPSSLLRGDPTSPLASSPRRCLLGPYRLRTRGDLLG